MTISQKTFLASGIALTILIAAGCGKHGPTAPISSGNAPAIASLSPSVIEVSPSPQTLAVSGTNFLSGLSFILRAPDGSTNTYTTQSISNLTNTSFTVSVVINATGNWTANVRNVDGLESTAAAFSVGGTQSNGPPQILSITPGSLFRNGSSQTFSVNGQNFRQGATVIVTNPAGSEIPSSVASQSETLIIALATFNTVGTYSVMVRNADGSASGIYSLTVNPAAP
jgi:hypothetical protein